MGDLSASWKGETGPFQRPSERVQEAVLCTAWCAVHCENKRRWGHEYNSVHGEQCIVESLCMVLGVMCIATSLWRHHGSSINKSVQIWAWIRVNGNISSFCELCINNFQEILSHFKYEIRKTCGTIASYGQDDLRIFLDFYCLAVNIIKNYGRCNSSYHGFVMREVSVNSTSLYETN